MSRPLKLARQITIDLDVWTIATEHAQKHGQSFSSLVEESLKEYVGMVPRSMEPGTYTAYSVNTTSGDITTSTTYLPKEEK